jgi:hypothetical protein
MFRLIRVPRSLDKCFRPLQRQFHWDHLASFRVLVLAMACAWGRQQGANFSRYLEAQHHRTRFNNVCLVRRWDPEVALPQKAQERFRARAPPPGDTG